MWEEGKYVITLLHLFLSEWNFWQQLENTFSDATFYHDGHKCYMTQQFLLN